MFNIIQFYQDNKIAYSLEGKNVVEGWVNIACPFCGDKSNHLGVLIRRPRKVKCWRCGEHTLPEVLEQFSDKSIKTLYGEYKTDGKTEVVELKKEKELLSSGEIEKTFQENSRQLTKAFPASTKYIKYLVDRNFNQQIEKDWGILSGIEMGEYRYRLMIPIYYNKQMVSFQGRDITGKQEDKYKTCHGTQINHYLYGLDYVNSDRVIICEGVTDVWRLGKGNAVATFGIEYSTQQVRLLVDAKIEYIIIFFDSEPQAQKKAGELKRYLELFDIECLNFTITGKDPASLKEKEVKKVLSLLYSM